LCHHQRDGEKDGIDGKRKAVCPAQAAEFIRREKYQVLEELKRSPGKQGEILRREGLFRNEIQRCDEIVREAGIKALSQMRPGKRRQQEVPLEQYDI